jgi:hypothetical protein
MKQRWHAWRKANPNKRADVTHMIEQGYELNEIMERLGGSAPTASASAPASSPRPSEQSDRKQMLMREVDRLNTRNGFR